MARLTQVKTVRILNNATGLPRTGVAVELKRGVSSIGTTEIGNGYYKVNSISPGQYSVFVGGSDSGETVAVGAGEVDKPDYTNNPNSYLKTDSSGDPQYTSDIDWPDIISTPTTLSGYGVTSVDFSVLTNKPTTMAGYGITDGAVVSGLANRIQISDGSSLTHDDTLTYDGTTLTASNITTTGNITASSGSLTIGVNATITGQTQSGSIRSGLYNTSSGDMTFAPSGSTKLTINSSGIDVTGSVTAGDASMANLIGGVPWVRFGHKNHNNLTGSGYAQHSDGSTRVVFPTGKNFRVRENNDTSKQLEFKDGNLDVTGSVTAGDDLLVNANLMRVNGPSNTDVYMRVTEADQFFGGYIHYEGNTNTLFMGTHNGASSDPVDDVNFLKVARGSQDVSFLGSMNIGSLPTSSSGLSSGDLYNDGGTVKIV